MRNAIDNASLRTCVGAPSRWGSSYKRRGRKEFLRKVAGLLGFNLKDGKDC